MNQRKNVFQLIGDWWANRQSKPQSNKKSLTKWLPTPGNVIFTILILGLLILTQNVWAKPLQSALNAPGPSATTINYQGRLANPDGTPVSDGVYDLKFALYDTSENGAMIWPASGTPELHQDVPVSDGLFSVGLGDGTVGGIPTTTWNGDRWLQVWVETEELSPRELIRSVPIAGMALTAQTADVALTAQTADVASTVSDGATTQGSLTIGNSLYVAGNYQDATAQDVNASGNGAMRLINGSNPNDWLGIDNNEITSYGSKLLLQHIDATENVKIGTNLEIAGSGQSIIINPQDVTPEGNAALRFGDGDNWLGIDNNEIISYGGVLHLQGSEATDKVEIHTYLEVNGTTYGNAYVELNLLTPEQVEMEVIENFAEGDLLCWSPDNQELELCAHPDTRLVMAVAGERGKPIVLGAEPIKVLGPVKAGDLLVSSNMPGYAMVNNNPLPGTVIAQALEDFNGESGLIKAMIRKW